IVGGILRCNHMAGRTAKGDSVHVSDAAITSNANDDEVDSGGEHDKVDAVPEYRIVDANLGEKGRHLVARDKIAPSDQDPDQDQHQSDDKDTWQQQSEENSQVGIGRSV